MIYIKYLHVQIVFNYFPSEYAWHPIISLIETHWSYDAENLIINLFHFIYLVLLFQPILLYIYLINFCFNFTKRGFCVWCLTKTIQNSTYIPCHQLSQRYMIKWFLHLSCSILLSFSLCVIFFIVIKKPYKQKPKQKYALCFFSPRKLLSFLILPPFSYWFFQIINNNKRDDKKKESTAIHTHPVDIIKIFWWNV